MEIPPNRSSSLDPVAKRRLDGAKVARGGQEGGSTERSDQVRTPDTDVVARYVAMVRAHGRDTGRLDELRQQISDGSFTATPEELADGLLDRLDDA